MGNFYMPPQAAGVFLFVLGAILLAYELLGGFRLDFVLVAVVAMIIGFALFLPSGGPWRPGQP